MARAAKAGSRGKVPKRVPSPPDVPSGSGTDQTGPPPERSLPTLEEIFVACQKSLARATLHAQQAGKSDSEFAQGERPVYMIDGVDLDLSASLVTERRPGEDDRIRLDFSAPAWERSRIRFRVQAKAIEHMAGAKLQLSNLDPMAGGGADARLRVWLVSSDGKPVPRHPVTLHFARPGSATEKGFPRAIDTKTDSVGRIDFWVMTKEDRVKIVGDRTPHEVHLRGSGRGRSNDEYFVWATCPRHPSWDKLAEPTPPLPPVDVANDDTGLPAILHTELMRLRIEREP